MALKIHGIDPNSDEFYIMARDYSICPEVETIAKIHKLPIQKVMILLEDADFTELVSNFRKQSIEKGKNPVRNYLESKNFYFIKKLEEVADNDEHPKQIEAIKQFINVSEELGKKQSVASQKKSGSSNNNVKIEVSKSIPFNPDFEEDEDDEEDEYED